MIIEPLKLQIRSNPYWSLYMVRDTYATDYHALLVKTRDTILQYMYKLHPVFEVSVNYTSD